MINKSFIYGDFMNVREELLKFKDEEYKCFISKLTRTRYPMIGIRIPLIKKFAKDISEKIDFKYFNCIQDPYFEEIMLEGFIIGNLKDLDLVIKRLNIFVSKIDDWSVCDSVCASLKITNKNKNVMWNFINKYKNSAKEFELRFMLIMMMDYYLEDKYIDDIFETINNLKLEQYYVKMAVAWLLATSIVKCEERTLEYIKRCNLDKMTFNKMISKCCESYRVKDEIKQLLKSMKNIKS